MHVIGIQLLRYTVYLGMERALLVNLLLDPLEVLLFDLRILTVHPLDFLLLVLVCPLDTCEVV